MLSGCAGFYVNDVKYYNEVLARVGEETITRFDLLNAYSSYGQNYYSQSGEGEDPLASTLNLLIDRSALYQYAKNNEDNLYNPTGYQIKEIANSTFEQLDEQMSSYINDAKQVLNLEVKKEEDATEEESSTAYPIKDYQYKKRAELVQEEENGQTVLKIKYLTEKEPVFGDQNFGSYKDLLQEKFVKNAYLEDYTFEELVEEVKTNYLTHLQTNLQKENATNANAIFNKVKEYLSRNLINYEFYLRDAQNKPLGKDFDGLLTRYFKRTLEAQIKSQYLTNLQEYYLSHENLDINELLAAYKEIVRYDYDKYTSSASTYKSDMKGLSTNGDSILYHLKSIDDGTQFGYFIHTLFQFSEQQKTDLGKLKDADGNYTDPAKYLEIVLNTEVAVRDVNSGVEVGKVKLKDVLNSEDYKNLCNNPNAEEFVNFMFKYTQDTATLASGMPYVVGSYNKDNEETFSTNSSMEEAFTNECIKLMQTQTPNTISTLVDGNGNLKDIEEFCITSYGVHIVCYVNPVYANDVSYADTNKVYFDLTNKDFDLDGELNLYKKLVNPLTNKTYFDVLFDKVFPSSSSNNYTSNTNYSNYEKSLTELAKNVYKVQKYQSKIKATKVN